MSKQEHIEELLEEILRVYQIPKEVLEQCAEDILYGMDMYREMSSDSIASSNRYQYLESEKEQAIKSKQQEIAKLEKKHKEELEEYQRNARWALQRKQEQIEELEKRQNG